MQLQEAGILSLEDPGAKYVPEYKDPVGRPPVRIWHLLCHSGGFFPLPRLVVDKIAQEMGISDSILEELVYRKDFAEQGIRLVAERLAAQTEFTGAPGQQFSYCNDGFGVLSDIVRRYGGYDSFAEYVEQKILQPLGMTFRKAEYIVDFAAKVQSGEFDLQAVSEMSDEEAIAQLSSLKGIGVWTAEMILLFCLQRSNVLSYGDLAIQRGMRMVYHHRKITPELFRKYKRRLSPYCSVASLYFWAVAGGAVPSMRDYAPKAPGKLSKKK